MAAERQAHIEPPTVSVLIVAYQSQSLIGRCLEALQESAGQTSIEILLIDNGDGETARAVKSQFPQVTIVPSEGNIGFARGNNVLGRHASGQYLLLLNPDMFARPGAIDRLVAAAVRLPDAAAWGGVTLDQNGRPDVGNAIAIPSLREFASAALGRSLARRGMTQSFVADEQVEVLSGGFVMIDRTAWEWAGGFDESFFLYCEEVDLFHRLRLAGHSLWQIADVRAEHALAHGANLSPLRLLYRTAGTMTFVRKHWPFPRWLLGGVLLWLAAAERLVAGRLLRRWKPHLGELAAAYHLVAMRPQLWFSGYDPNHGLMARMKRGDVPEQV